MAKKTAKKAAPAKPAAKPVSKKGATAKVAAKKPTPTPAATAKGLDNDQIGHAAGAVWGCLHGKGWQTLAAVKKNVDAPTEVTMLALGWLAREGKLDFTTSGRSVKVTLRA